MLRASSSTSSTVRPTRSSSELCSRSSMRCFSGGKLDTSLCRKSAVSSSSRSGDSTPFTTTLRAMVCSSASSSGCQFAPGEHHDRNVGETRDHRGSFPAPRSRSCRAAADPGPRSRCLPLPGWRGLGAVLGAVTMSMSSWPKQLGDAEPLGSIVLHDQQALAARLGEVLDARERRAQALPCSPAW